MEIYKRGIFTGLIVGIISIVLNLLSLGQPLPNVPTILWSSLIILLITVGIGYVTFLFYGKLKSKKELPMLAWVGYWVVVIIAVLFVAFWILSANLALSLAP